MTSDFSRVCGRQSFSIMTTTILATALLAMCIDATYTIDDFDVIQGSNWVCFDAKNYYSVTTLTAPKNGTIAGIQLRYITGSVSCHMEDDSSYTKWGCGYGALKFYTMFLRVTDEDNFIGDLYYPQRTTQVNHIHLLCHLHLSMCLNTQDIQIQDDPPGSSDYVGNCSHGCVLGPYTLTNTANASSPSFTLIQPTYDVTTSDLFMLQYLEACCPDELNISDNDGDTCAYIDFLYSLVYFMLYYVLTLNDRILGQIKCI